MTSRVKHAVDSIIWTSLGQGISIILSFVVRSILLKQLGSEFFGLNSVFKSIIGTLNVTELGFNTALVYCMYKPYAEGDTQRISAILYLYRKIYFIIGCFILVAGIILSFFLEKLISSSIPLGINIRIPFFSYLASSVINYYLWTYKTSLLFVAQRNDVNSKITCINFFVLYTLQIFVLYIYKSFYFYAFIFPLASILAEVIQYCIISKMFPSYKKNTRIILEKKFYKDLFKRVIGMAFSKIRNVSRSSVDTLFVSSFLGLIITAKYSVYTSILLVPNVLLNIILLPSVASSIGNYFAVENKNAQYDFFRLYSFIVFWIVTWETVCYLCIVQDFVILWVGSEQLLSTTEIILFALSFYVQGLSMIFERIKDATGLYWNNRFTPLVEMFVNIILDYVGVRLFGIPGVIAATCISVFLITIPSDCYILFKHYFNRSLDKYILFFIYELITSFCIIGFSFYLSFQIYVSNLIIQSLIKIILCIFLPNLLFLLLNMNSKYLKDIRSIVKSRDNIE